MADFDSVRQTIDASIKQNGTGAITGPVLNGVLNEMVDAADEQVSQLGQQVIYDVTKNNPTAGPNNDGKYESLSALLSDANLSTLIPIAVRCGGMSIRFVQTSDNKYVQYRLTEQAFTTDVTKWQKQGAEVSVFDNTLMIGNSPAMYLDNTTGIIKNRFCGDSTFGNGRGYIIAIKQGDELYIKAPSTNACTFAYLSDYSDTDSTPQIIGTRHSIYAGYEIADSDKIAPSGTKYVWINLISTSGNGNIQKPEIANINGLNVFGTTFSHILSLKKEHESDYADSQEKDSMIEENIGIFENKYPLLSGRNFGKEFNVNIPADGSDLAFDLAVPADDITSDLSFWVTLTFADNTTDGFFVISNSHTTCSYAKDIKKINIALYNQGSAITNDTTLSAKISGGGMYGDVASLQKSLQKEVHNINTKIGGYLYSKYLLATTWGEGESIIFQINEGDSIYVEGNGQRGTFAFLSAIKDTNGNPVYSNVASGEDGRFVVDALAVTQVAPVGTKYLVINKLRNGNNVYPSVLTINGLDTSACIIQDIFKIAQMLERADTTNVEILAPSVVHAVTGTKVNICFDSVVTVKDFSQLSRAFTEGSFIQVENESQCTVGDSDIDAKISAYLTPAFKVQHQMTVKPVAVNAGSGKTWNVLCLGESTTDNPYVVKDLYDMFDNDAMSINLIGTKDNPAGIKNEGRGGWTLGMYRHTAEHAGVINPFYNPSTQDFDFSYYRTTYNIAAPDVVIIYMGINDTANNRANFITDYDYIINSIKTNTPDVKIVVCPPNVCSCVKSTWTYRQNYKVKIQNTIKELMTHYGGRESENIYLCCAYVAVNTIYDMDGVTERNISSFNTEFKGLYIPANRGDVHPSAVGYMKIATWWYDIIKYIASLD